jgi:hypothetical protein
MRLNVRIAFLLAIPALLVAPLVNHALAQLNAWITLLTTTTSALVLSPLSALLVLGLVCALLYLSRSFPSVSGGGKALLKKGGLLFICQVQEIMLDDAAAQIPTGMGSNRSGGQQGPSQWIDNAEGANVRFNLAMFARAISQGGVRSKVWRRQSGRTERH